MKGLIIFIAGTLSLLSVPAYFMWSNSVATVEVVQKLEVTQNLGRGNWKTETWLLSDGNCVDQFTDREYPRTMYKITKNSGEVIYTLDIEKGYDWKPVEELHWRN